MFLSLLIAFIAGGLLIKENEKNTTKNIDIPPEVTASPLPWPRYTSTKYGFSLEYPFDVTVTERNENVSFFKKGPSQAEATEFYDGISIIISSGALQGKSLKDIAEGKIKEMQMHAEITKPVTETSLNRKKGYTYTASGVGTFTEIILPKGNEEYLHITNGTIDPTKQGFVIIADKMLKSLEIE